MSKRVKIFAIIAMIAGAIAMVPGSALAYHHHGGSHHGHGHYGGYHHGGGYYYGGGWGWGGFGWGWGPAFAYYPPVYYAPTPECGWVHIRVWRHGHWELRRAWECW
jgi:hypothetical protein